MSNMKNFKSIADDVMSGVAVSGRLKAQTLQKCVKKHRLMRAVLVTATSLAAVVLVCVIAISLPKSGGDNTPNIMMATDSASPLMTGQESSVTEEEAGTFFGEGLLTPQYAPRGFALQSISLTGDDSYKQVTLVYSDGANSYAVTEEKPYVSGGFEGFGSADINGVEGYIKPAAAGPPDAEVHWTLEEAHYAVTGSISESEALAVARSMK